MDREVHQTFYDGYENGHKVYYSLRSLEEIEQDEALNDARDETMLSIDSHFRNLSDEALAVLEAIFVSDVPIGEFLSFHRPQVAKMNQQSDPTISHIASNLTKEAISSVKHIAESMLIRALFKSRDHGLLRAYYHKDRTIIRQ